MEETRKREKMIWKEEGEVREAMTKGVCYQYSKDG